MCFPVRAASQYLVFCYDLRDSSRLSIMKGAERRPRLPEPIRLANPSGSGQPLAIALPLPVGIAASGKAWI